MADNNKQLGNNHQIKFLHGTQSAIDKMMSPTATETDKAKIEAGAFYLTTDSHRMYLAQADKTIVPVNDSIQKIATINDLPNITYVDDTISTFYYCIDENVLCIGVADKVTGGWKWIQINPDTSITERSFTTSKTDNAVKVTDAIADSNNDNYTAFWGFDEDGGNVTITVAEKTYTEGTGENIKSVTRQMFTIKCNVIIGTETSDTTGIIKLTNSGDDTQKVTVKPAENSKILISSDNIGNITIDDKDLRADDITGIAQSFDSTGTLTTTLSKGTDNIDVTIKPIIKYGKDEAGKTTAEVAFVNGTAVLDVYTAEQVDDKIAKDLAIANAMTFIGVLSPDSDTHKVLPTTNVRVGDTYKVGKNQSYDTTGKAYAMEESLDPGETWAIKGDLFIATGEEVPTTGYIDSNNIVWEYIPAGNEESVDYKFSTQDHGLKIDIGNDTLLDFKLAESSTITLSDKTTDSGKGRTVTINHANVGRTDDTEEDLDQDKADLTEFVSTNEFTHVTEVTTNDQGHVIGITTQKVTLTDTNASLKEVDLDAAPTGGATNSVTLTSKVTLLHPADTTDSNDYKSDSIAIKSINNNLAVTVDSGAIALNLVWGTF